MSVAVTRWVLATSLWVLAACGPSDGVTSSLGAVPREAVKALAHCDTEVFEELEITCRVQAAANAANQGKFEVAEVACAGIAPAVWREECHFRAGEEFGRAGDLERGLGHCARAGQYSRFCLTHLTWNTPADASMTPSAPESVLEVAQSYGQMVDRGLVGATKSFAADARGTLRSRFWFNLYVGSGSADPAAARRAPAGSDPSARLAFAIEAVRLLAPPERAVGAELLDEVLDVWFGRRAPPVGEPLPARERHGRYHPFILTDEERGLPLLSMYGGGRRLVSADPQADLRVSVLEAMYFRPQTEAQAFLPFVSDDDATVRRTAARMVRVTPSRELVHEQVLRAFVEGDDAGVAAHGRDGLRHREWQRFTGGPRPR